MYSCLYYFIFCLNICKIYDFVWQNCTENELYCDKITSFLGRCPNWCVCVCVMV